MVHLERNYTSIGTEIVMELGGIEDGLDLESVAQVLQNTIRWVSEGTQQA